MHRYTPQKKKKSQQVKIKLKYADLTYSHGDYFEIEEVKQKRVVKGNIEYLCKWVGWPDASNTWEPKEHLKAVKHLILKYELENSVINPDSEIEKLVISDDDPNSLVSVPYGNLENDVPMRIVYIETDYNNQIMAEVEWMMRKENGIKPENSSILKDDLKENYLRMLIDYYETKFRYIT